MSGLYLGPSCTDPGLAGAYGGQRRDRETSLDGGYHPDEGPRLQKTDPFE